MLLQNMLKHSCTYTYCQSALHLVMAAAMLAMPTLATWWCCCFVIKLHPICKYLHFTIMQEELASSKKSARTQCTNINSKPAKASSSDWQSYVAAKMLLLFVLCLLLAYMCLYVYIYCFKQIYKFLSLKVKIAKSCNNNKSAVMKSTHSTLFKYCATLRYYFKIIWFFLMIFF